MLNFVQHRSEIYNAFPKTVIWKPWYQSRYYYRHWQWQNHSNKKSSNAKVFYIIIISFRVKSSI